MSLPRRLPAARATQSWSHLRVRGPKRSQRPHESSRKSSILYGRQVTLTHGLYPPYRSNMPTGPTFIGRVMVRPAPFGHRSGVVLHFTPQKSRILANCYFYSMGYTAMPGAGRGPVRPVGPTPAAGRRAAMVGVSRQAAARRPDERRVAPIRLRETARLRPCPISSPAPRHPRCNWCWC